MGVVSMPTQPLFKWIEQVLLMQLVAISSIASDSE